MQLSEVLYKVAIRKITGSTDVEINDVQIDSRQVTPGSAFIAMKGGAMDGHQFIESAIRNGAKVIVHEEMIAEPEEGVVYVQAENSSSAAAYMAQSYYNCERTCIF